MGSVFKTLTANDRSITPFIAHKEITAISGSNSSIILYRGKFDNANYNIGDVIDPNVSALLKSNNKYQYLIHDSLNHLFYRQYYNNEIRTITDNVDKNNIYEYVSCFSIPRSEIGSGLTKDNISLDLTVETVTKQLVDDGNYNLIDQNVSSSLYSLISSGSVAKYDFSDGYVLGSNQISNNYLRDRSNQINDMILNNISFIDSDFGKEVCFDSTSSFARITKNESFNFHGNDDFNISSLIRIPNASIYSSTADEMILTKNVGIIVSGDIGNPGTNRPNKLFYSSYPFAISVMKAGGDYGKIRCNKFDGITTTSIISTLAYNDNTEHYIDFQKSGSYLQLYVDGVLDSQTSDLSTNQTNNDCDLFIGMKGDNTQNFNGYIKSIDIKENALTDDLVLYRAQQILSQSFDYYVGNVFYDQGFATITSNEQFYRDFNSGSLYTSWSFSAFGTNTIYEHEYLCTFSPSDFNYSTNPTLLKNERNNHNEYIGIVSHSMFTPYFTTIGLYNDNNELLAIGKLSTPIPRTKKLDTTVIVRFDV